MASSLKRIYLKNKKDIFLSLIALLAFLTLVPVFTYAFFAKDLSTPENIMNKNNTGVTLYDRHGKVFYKFYEAQFRSVIPLEEIPYHMQEAVIASEDKEFYQHPGFSIKSMLAALVADIRKGEIAYGGSTITQQLVKNTLLSTKKSFLRKYQELVLAQEIDRRYSKKAILSMYLNSVYFGEGAFGIEEASKTYFGIPASRLSVSQASFLAGILTAPSEFSPLSGDVKKAYARQEYVLENMVEQGYITNEQRDNAQKGKLEFSEDERYKRFKAPHFALMVKDELIKKYGEEQIARSGYHVYTTLDLDWQEYAEGIVANQVVLLAGNNASNGSAVVIDPKNGEIRVLVGSRNWYKDKVNVATSLRQPGSSFKPIVYARALEDRDITPASILMDAPRTFAKTYSPKNYDGKFRGPVTARRALANSLNVPSVEVMYRVGLEDTIESVKKFGITTIDYDPSRFGLSLVLGAGEVKLVELTSAYAVFANNGEYIKPTTITSIKNKYGEKVYQHKLEKKRAISHAAAFLIASILSDNKARSEIFGNTLTISRPAAVKTGTTESYRDALTLGFTPSLAIGTWVGNNDGAPMDNVAGSLGAAPIWKALMEEFLKGTPVEQFILPQGVVSMTNCNYITTMSAQVEYFIEGTQTKRCTLTPTIDPNATPTGPITPTGTTQSPSPSVEVPTVSPAPQSTPTSQPTSTPFLLNGLRKKLKQ